jgi:hypothetical protein
VKEIIEEIRTFMVQESHFFFSQQESSLADFDFQDIKDAKNSYSLRLILDKEKG